MSDLIALACGVQLPLLAEEGQTRNGSAVTVSIKGSDCLNGETKETGRDGVNSAVCVCVCVSNLDSVITMINDY